MNIENKLDIDHRITSIITNLQTEKKDRSDTWTKSIASDIGILCNSLSNIKSPDGGLIDLDNLKVAIRVVAAIQYAKESGVAEAKKRILNLSFLKNNSPQLSNTYLENELIIYSFSALNNLKEDWCLKYICDEIRSITLRENIKPLIQWLEKLNLDLNQQISNLNNARPSLFSEDEWIIFIIEFVSKNVKKDFSKFDKSSVQFLSNLLTNKNRDEIKLAVADQIYQLSQINPFILFRAEIANYLSLSIESKSKKVYALTNQICERFLIIFSQLIEFNSNKTVIDDLRSLWSIYESLLNKKDAAKKNSVLTSLISSTNNTELGHLSKGVEYLAADLLSTWEDLPEPMRSDPISQELFNKLEILKINLSISQYCTQGQVISYDPLFQEPISKDFIPTDSVNIFKPGYFQTRANGTIKVIKKALVKN